MDQHIQKKIKTFNIIMTLLVLIISLFTSVIAIVVYLFSYMFNAYFGLLFAFITNFLALSLISYMIYGIGFLKFKKNYKINLSKMLRFTFLIALIQHIKFVLPLFIR
ncbi:MAG: hypothetical protein IJH34_14080 [Romboutsia sp.]|nr:hypothetical protein [Romboutsia sp.]